MKIKPGVDARGIKPETVLAMILCEPVVKSHGVEFVVTSICDGKHLPRSKHYEGHAIDVRTRDMAPERIRPCVQELQIALGSQYDVVLEGDHIHVEFDPKQQP